MEMRNPVMLILQDRRLFLQSALACNQRFVGCDDIFRGKCQNISSSRPALCHGSEHICGVFGNLHFWTSSLWCTRLCSWSVLRRYFNLLSTHDGQSLFLKNWKYIRMPFKTFRRLIPCMSLLWHCTSSSDTWRCILLQIRCRTDEECKWSGDRIGWQNWSKWGTKPVTDVTCPLLSWLLVLSGSGRISMQLQELRSDKKLN